MLFKKIVISVLIYQEHIQEIFSTYGKIKTIDLPVERLLPHLTKGIAYVEFETPEEAQKALKYMDGGGKENHLGLWRDYIDRCKFDQIIVSGDYLTGQIDGQEITAAAVLTQMIRGPARRMSPPRRMPPPPPMWRRSPPRMRRRLFISI